MPRPVVIVPYDPDWPRIYEGESDLIRGAVGGIIRSLEHVGSTSVPGLWAKPIIDIIAGVTDTESAERCRFSLHDFGYDTPHPVTIPTGTTASGRPTIARVSTSTWSRKGVPITSNILSLRLATYHPIDTETYKNLKISLSEKFWNDRVVYTEAKTDFINGVVKKAEKIRA